MSELRKFQVPVLLIVPSGTGPIEKTASFAPLEGTLESLSSPKEGYYKVVVAIKKVLPNFSEPGKKSKAEKAFRRAARKIDLGKKAFCLSEDRLSETELSFLIGKKVRIEPNLIAALA